MSVSRVLRDPLSVSHPLRDRIQRAIDDLKYVPNRAAQMLSGAPQLRIGLMYNQPRSAYAVDLLLGAMDQASISNVQLILRGCKISRDDNQVMEQLIEQNVDAIILTAPLCESKRLVRMLEEAKIPGVLVGTESMPSIGAALHVDDFAAAYELTSYIVSSGHRRVGFILGGNNLSATAKRFNGYRKALKDAAITFEDKLVAAGRFTYQSGLEAAAQLLHQANPPTAIFASNDDMAVGTIAAAHRLGIEVPKDLTVCGFDDSWIALNVWPELTTIRQPVEAMGGQAVKILRKLILEKEAGFAAAVSICLPHEIILRASDAAPK